MVASPVCSCSYPASALRGGERRLRGFQGRSVLPGWHRRENRRKLRALAGPDHWHALAGFAGPLMDHLFLAYERVVYPCQNMNCGDVVYRRYALIENYNNKKDTLDLHNERQFCSPS